METLVKGYKKSTAVDLVSQAGKAAAGKKLEAAIVVLELKGQDIAKWRGVDFKGAKMTFIDSENVDYIELRPITDTPDRDEDQDGGDGRRKEIYGMGKSSKKSTGKAKPGKSVKHEVTFPKGFEKGTKVKFEAAGTSATPGAKLTGVIKNIFWDKQSQSEYFTIESGGKLYTKRPANVVLATVKGKK